eukprot:2775412-Rhodomonas_salina.1
MTSTVEDYMLEMHKLIINKWSNAAFPICVKDDGATHKEPFHTLLFNTELTQIQAGFAQPDMHPPAAHTPPLPPLSLTRTVWRRVRSCWGYLVLAPLATTPPPQHTRPSLLAPLCCPHTPFAPTEPHMHPAEARAQPPPLHTRPSLLTPQPPHCPPDAPEPPSPPHLQRAEAWAQLLGLPGACSSRHHASTPAHTP